jgi:transcriptional regulator with XRE-family HTH domain
MRRILVLCGYCCGGIARERVKGELRERVKRELRERVKGELRERVKGILREWRLTPFGEKLRALRQARGVLQRDMAAALEISAAYLSALEHGRRGTPSAGLIHQICQYFGLIWDDADELAALAKASRPRVRLNAGGLTAAQTALANRMARELRYLDPGTVAAVQSLLDQAQPAQPASAPQPRKKPSNGSRLRPRMVK